MLKWTAFTYYYTTFYTSWTYFWLFPIFLAFNNIWDIQSHFNEKTLKTYQLTLVEAHDSLVVIQYISTQQRTVLCTYVHQTEPAHKWIISFKFPHDIYYCLWYGFYLNYLLKLLLAYLISTRTSNINKV